ncbi:haloacetate dehalogenase [Methylohalomonas lacus]|uniref:Haloacetate dehalogenase n=1 Tax=Methylohalomonas lacus TaxID=398773 RepID=A0AAE3HMF3_9GAMM|nr:alpha/beta hydrolase [Methylohalomonas lacus]MCS3903826.1 haloacetate dehalogenase [Methylohalomonas lacus]
MFEQFTRHDIPVAEGVSIRCMVGGSGPAVLLLHGFPQNLATWARVAPQLAEHYTVVCADLRGYGDSSKPDADGDPQTYSFRTMATDNVALMQTLGYERFHLVGHDRGGRVGYRLAQDQPDRLISLTVMDIVPTWMMWWAMDKQLATLYWHWSFLAQPSPLPEHMIGLDPDAFFEYCLCGWGRTGLDAFNPEQLAEYRRCWRDPAMIQGACDDYRAAATIDVEHDQAALDERITTPMLLLYGEDGVMNDCFDIAGTWRPHCEKLEIAALPGGHFFVDTAPTATAGKLLDFLDCY